MSIEEIRERDSAAADTWFKGPASFTAQAARDRRALLDAIKALREENERLGRALIRYGVHCTTADQEPCGGNAFSCTCGFSAALSPTAPRDGESKHE
jgi:hypothetical protein